MNSTSRTSSRALLVAFSVLCGAVLLAAVPASAQRETAEISGTRTVKVGDNFFSPKSVKIRRNSKVRFRWNRTRKRHNVAVRSGPVRFKSRTRRGRYTYTRKFTKRGTYRLYCTIHPRSMRATVRVR